VADIRITPTAPCLTVGDVVLWPGAVEAEVEAPARTEAETEAGAEARDPLRAAANAAMERYARGDDDAFSELYDVLAPRIHQYLVRQTRDPSRADDLLQQTLLHIHRARGRFLAGAEVLPWAFAISRRLLIDSIRRRKNEVPVTSPAGGEAVADGRGADELLDSKRLALALERELGRLPEPHRVAFELIKKEGLSVREAAEVLGTTVTAVKLRAHRAYVALRAALGEVVDRTDH
jgi:RNA polymerase sigma-70 factor (ECF subfamily)